MGIPVEPVDYGTDCLFCWNPGNTPRTVFAVFTGVPVCPFFPEAVPDGVPLAMAQDPVNPCLWDTGQLTQWRSIFTVDETHGNLGLIFNPSGQGYYSGNSEIMCGHSFPTNDVACVFECPLRFDCPAGQIYPVRAGSAGVYYSEDTTPDTLCETMGFHPGPKNLYEKTA